MQPIKRASRAIVLAVCTIIALTASAVLAAVPTPTVSLTATPNTGTSPLTFTLSWTSTGAAACVGTGAWNGAKALSGSQVIAGLTTNATYTLTCTAAGGWADLTWTPPTLNEDGTALTNLASYKVYAATTALGVPTATPLIVLAPASAYTINNLAPGTWYFAMKATNALGVDSVITGNVSKDVVAPSASVSANVIVTTQPKPPGGLAVSQTMAFDLKPNGKINQLVGVVPLGIPCGAFATRWGQDAYYYVPADQVAYTSSYHPTRVVAQCSQT